MMRTNGPRNWIGGAAGAARRIASVGVIGLLLGALVLGQGVKETTDIVAGIQQRKIQVKVNGAGIDQIQVAISRPPGSAPTTVRIPTGTLFASSSGGVQNMVATESATADLTGTLSAVITVAVACANMHLGVPDESDTFSVQRAPNQAELQAVLPVLSRAGAEYAVKQAAVWIITDDADYGDLGTLVSGPFAGARSREINYPEAANAMMYIDRAKGNLQAKAIWQDRLAVCEEVVGTVAAAGAWCGTVLRDTTDARWKIERLGHQKRSLRDIARTGLLKAAGPDDRSALLSALPSAGNAAAPTLAQALGNFADPEVADALVGMLTGGPAPVRLAAIQALGRIKSDRAVGPLATILEGSEPPSLRLAAVKALCAVPDPAVESRMIAFLADRAADVRVESMRCLGSIGAEDSIVALEPLLKAPQQAVRTTAATAVKRIRSRMATPVPGAAPQN